jgi:spermidine synthase
MTDIESASDSAAQAKFYPVLFGCFFGSGLAALIYEIVWFQLLEFIIGSTAASLAVLLGTFMGGMCLGSLVFARAVPATLHPLRIYAALEIGIGLTALLVWYFLPPAADVYAIIGGQAYMGILFRGLLCAAFLLAPTALMGATLPCAARWVESTREGVSWLGILYTGNLAGAVFGCLLAGFYLLRLHDMATATFVAAAFNALCAMLALLVAAVAPHRVPAMSAAADRAPFQFRSMAVYLTIALSGMTALGAQVVWTRLLSLLLGPTVYTFSIILAVFLLGLGLGSGIGSRMARSARNPLFTLGWCQFFLIFAIAWAAISIDAWLPFWPIDPRLSLSPWSTFQLDLARVLWAVLPAACLWGASFPLALAAAAPWHNDSGHMVGAVYAANTVGAIIGAIGAALILIPTLGTLWSQRILIIAAATAAMLIWLAGLHVGIPQGVRRMPRTAVVSGLAAVPIAAAVLVYGLPPVAGYLYIFGRKIMNPGYLPTILYVGEGMNSSVAVSEDDKKTRSFHVSGQTEAGTNPIDMRLQRMLASLPVLLAPKPRSALVVGFGAGVTAGTLVAYPGIERIVICEIEPLIPQKISGFFSAQNFNVVKDPRVEIVYDDARRFILTSHEQFDIITSDPIHPWLKGSASLYTREYFEHVKQHLKPGGVVTHWVPMYETTIDSVKSEMATFFAVFPDGIVWVNDRDNGGDLVLFGQVDPKPIDVDKVTERFNTAESARVAKALGDVGFASAVDLLSSYAGHAPELAVWLKDAAINTDRDLRLQYLAGMGLNVDAQDEIYFGLAQVRRLPSGIFVGSEETLAELRKAIDQNKRRPGEPSQQQ